MSYRGQKAKGYRKDHSQASNLKKKIFLESNSIWITVVGFALVNLMERTKI